MYNINHQLNKEMVKIMKKIIALSLICMSLVGCQVTRQNAITGEYETNSTVKGGLLGCVAGAVVGGALNGGKGAAIGCGAGGGAGLFVGNNFDKQEAELRKQLLNSGVQVKRQGNEIRLIMNGAITFNTGKSSLKQAVYPKLRSIVTVMNRYPDTVLLVEGHTDSVGSSARNKELSFYRAQSVKTALNTMGLSSTRTDITGYGESMPICSNKTEQGRQCNRRVELRILPNG